MAILGVFAGSVRAVVAEGADAVNCEECWRGSESSDAPCARTENPGGGHDDDCPAGAHHHHNHFGCGCHGSCMALGGDPYLRMAAPSTHLISFSVWRESMPDGPCFLLDKPPI